MNGMDFLVALRNANRSLYLGAYAPYLSEAEREAAYRRNQHIEIWLIKERTPNVLGTIFEWRMPGPGGFW